MFSFKWIIHIVKQYGFYYGLFFSAWKYHSLALHFVQVLRCHSCLVLDWLILITAYNTLHFKKKIDYLELYIVSCNDLWWKRIWKRIWIWITLLHTWNCTSHISIKIFNAKIVTHLALSKDIQWKGHLFWMLVLKGLVGLHRTVQLQLLQHYWLGHKLGLLWYWMVCLRNEQRSFCRFWDCIQVLHFGLFCWPWWLLHFFWGIPAHSSRYNGHLS